ncbi:MAG: hypothetical protein HQK83_15610 [Fibrobacteria bacterium]|nr:hypothetical protein [Fibrobacteria bacterium]
MAGLSLSDPGGFLPNIIHTSVQRFGYCGEADNPLRRTPKGLVSWLVWNQKDLDKVFLRQDTYGNAECKKCFLELFNVFSINGNKKSVSLVAL